MSYLALYRKYRPNSFEELVGQTYVSEIIKKEILNDQISHAYLFAGPRGTGKTSTAKIIARMINCLNLSDDGRPCGRCINCININNSDIVEIDAASNNGVAEIRELKDKVNLVPTTGRYKIYIIDEVHMLTTQAFNALLKTLEEPPAHIIFILATTELYKIPITVISRCQKFQFNKFSDEEIVSRLATIANMENISISEDVLYEIARLSDGGLRDAINMLDQLSSYKNEKIDVFDVYRLNGVLSYDEIYLLLRSVYDKNISSIVSFIEDLDKKGNSITKFLEDLMLFLKDTLLYINSMKSVSVIAEKQNKIEKISKLYSRKSLYDFIFSVNDLLNKIKVSSCSSILTVAFFVEFSISLQSGNLDNLKDNKSIFSEKALNEELTRNSCDNSENLKTNINQMEEVQSSINDFELSEKIRKIRINNAFATASKSFKDYVVKNWNSIDNKLLDLKYGSIAGILNDTKVAVVGDGYIIMIANYDSLVRRLYNNLSIIEDLFYEVFNKKYKIVFLAKDEWYYEKNKYIENTKKGFKYNLLLDNDDIEEVNDNTDIEKIISILGEDIIEYK